MAKRKGGLPAHTQTGKKSAVSPLSSNHRINRDGSSKVGGVTPKGIEGLRHSVTKPNGQPLGTIGSSGPLAKVGTDTDKQNTTLGRVYIKTKPNK